MILDTLDWGDDFDPLNATLRTLWTGAYEVDELRVGSAVQAAMWARAAKDHALIQVHRTWVASVTAYRHPVNGDVIPIVVDLGLSPYKILICGREAMSRSPNPFCRA